MLFFRKKAPFFEECEKSVQDRVNLLHLPPERTILKAARQWLAAPSEAGGRQHQNHEVALHVDQTAELPFG